jgi:AraC family transcriptional regulator, chitin signaling transcriptional activator
MRPGKYIILLSFLIFISIEIMGQELFPILNYTTDEYQGETQNWGLCQSPEKSIYFANNKGLLEYNGANWKLYPSPNHTIMRSVNAQGDKIYTGCYMEFGYWVRDEFNNLKYTSLSGKIKSKLLEDEQFWKILCYQQWVLFQSLHRIYIYDSQHNTFEFITSKTILPKVFVAGNQVYFQKMDEGLFQLENGKTVLVSDFPDLKKSIIINIFVHSSKLLIQTQDKGFFVLDRGKVTPWQIDAASKINSLSVYSSLQLQDGSLVLGTVGEGLYILSPDGKISMHIDKKNGLQNNTVLSLLEDKDNNIWLGLDNGISVLNYTSPFHVYNDTKGNLGSVYATAEYEDFLYLGTNQGLFCKPANSTDDFTIIEGTKGQVWALKIIDGTLFCGHNSGTFIISNNRATLISNIMGTWDLKPVLNHDDLIIQGNYEGLHVLAKSNGRWKYRNKIEGFNISSRCFEILPNNQVAVNHEYRGVFTLDITTDFRKIDKISKEQSVPTSINSGLALYDEKLFYFGDSGFYEYEQKAKQFKKDSLLNKLIFGADTYISGKLIGDENKILWAFTDENIIALSRGGIDNKPQITRIALPLSLRENVVGYENLLHLVNKNYLLGTSNGYIVFDLNKVKDEKFFIHINSIVKSKITEDITFVPLRGEGYELKAKENNICFCYNVPVYDRFILTKFQYKLEGIYENWSDWTNESKISFKNLPAGDYTFKVRARIGNKLTENTASFAFSVARSWYLSGWMKLIYVLLFLILLILINRFYKKRYTEHKEKIDQEKKKELALLQLENEKEIIKLKNESLNSEMEAINRELASTTMVVAKKNELLTLIKNKLSQEKDNRSVKAALQIIDENVESNSNWEAFKVVFNNVDRDFLKKLKELHPHLTPNDLKLCAYLRLNLSSKEIAPLLNISPQSVEIARFRLRKKMDLDHEINLTEYILNI